MNDQSDITKRLWPIGLPGNGGPGSVTSTGISFQQFPNGAQLNQIWMDSLAKGMAQMEGVYAPAPATDLTLRSPRPLPQSVVKQGATLPSSIPSNIPSSTMAPIPLHQVAAPVSSVDLRQQQHRQQHQQHHQQLPSPSTHRPMMMHHQQHPPSEAAAEAERKRKNREFAKRSREKRKNAQRVLEDELAALQMTNNRLRQIIQEKIPTLAQSILKKCCADHPLHHAAKNPSGNKKEDSLASSDFHLLENLIKQQQSFCLTDPAQPDNPIVYASENFYKLSGYTKETTLGRNCRFLQGKDTDIKSVAMIRESIEEGKDISVNLLNYKADGTPFWNQFFIAALRNRTGTIVNYVGVQCEIDEPKDEKNLSTASDSSVTGDIGAPIISPKPAKKSIRIQGPPDIGGGVAKPDPLISEVPAAPALRQSVTYVDHEESLQPLDFSVPLKLGDWSVLAGVLEDDFKERMTRDTSFEDFDMATSSVGDGDTTVADQADDINDGDFQEQPQLEYHTLTPRAFVTKTCRSELVDSLLAAHGDVTDARFLKALEVLSSIYASYDPEKPSPETCIDNFLLNGAWVSLSRPAYSGCLGKNDRGDYMYTLGKMSFNMFKPADLKCSIQHTLNKVGFVCDMNEALTAVPWSLRREFAMTETEDLDDSAQPSKILRSYDIEVAVTIEPSDDEMGDSEGVAPLKPLRAVQVVNGYLLRDPEENNRLSVWFTGGRLAPFTPPESPESMADETEYGNFEEWKEIFDRDYKTSWSESFKNMGAMLFLGAELPQGMNPDGSMSYSLTRPYGGHGKSFIDVLYVDEGLFITRGNYGTIHVGIRSNLLCPTLPDIDDKDPTVVDPIVSSSAPVEATPLASNKRKAVVTNGESENGSAEHSMIWRDALTRDLESRVPTFVAEDLNAILTNYGLVVKTTTKRLKPS